MRHAIDPQKIRQQRERCGLTKREVALRTSIHVDTIDHIERGCYRSLTTERLATLANALGTSPETLLAGTGPDWWIWTGEKELSGRQRILAAYRGFVETHGQRPSEILLHPLLAKQVSYKIPTLQLVTQPQLTPYQVGLRAHLSRTVYPVSCRKRTVAHFARTWLDYLTVAPGLSWPVVLAASLPDDPVTVDFPSERLAGLFEEILKRYGGIYGYLRP